MTRKWFFVQLSYAKDGARSTLSAVAATASAEGRAVRLTRPGVAWMLSCTVLAAPISAEAQTDYYNTDRGRPITVEDAYATERYAFELQLAPLRFERGGGVNRWGAEPELAYGILPRTHIEVGVPVAWARTARGYRAGVAGLEVSVLHNLNTETRTLPALAIVGEVLAPVGTFGPARTYTAATAIATRTYPWARFHANAQYTLGPTSAASDGASGPELSRWLAGMAVDRTFPLRALLITGEFVARKPLARGEAVAWDASTGLRYQIDHQVSFDAGLGKRLTGSERSWFVTVGFARAFGLRALMKR